MVVPDIVVSPVTVNVCATLLYLKLDSATAELVVPSDVNILLSPGVDIVLNPVPLVPDVPLTPLVPDVPLTPLVPEVPALVLDSITFVVVL